MQDIKAASWTNDSYQWTGYTNGTRSYTANGLNQYATAAGSTLSYDGNLGGDAVCPFGSAETLHESIDPLAIGATGM
ncbi:hypothetical protein [Methylomonas sp. ZR1]|uniref:hypothetical protein n=1 Tax=Methylomonas sp. ZR1 TaxID=1797072 RepID=UPI0034644CCB